MTTRTGQELSQEAMTNVPSISCEEYKKLRADGTPHVFLDVREQDEWDAGHVEGAVHIPRGFLEFKIEAAVPDKAVKIILCCAKGARAALAGETLQKMGYTDVEFLKGGYTEYCEGD